MPLPINAEDEISRSISGSIADRPGDEIYPRVKPYVEQINAEESEIKQNLILLIIEDLQQDLALSSALDSVGEVIEYLAQDRQIEKPEFSGEVLMRNFSRISKLHLSLNYAKSLGLKEDAFDAVLHAEIDRLWQGDTNSALIKQLLLNKMATTPAATPAVSYPPMYTEAKKEKKKN